MKLINLFTKSEYAICYRFSDKDILDDIDTEYKLLMPTKKEWYADPFVYFHNDEIYVFMEVMFTDKGYAGLGYSKLVNGKLTAPKVIIDYGQHMSFPFIFDYNGQIYLIPETRAEKKIKLYRCVEFPEKWEEIHHIDDDRALYDSVVFENNGCRFMFTSEERLDVMYGSILYLLELEADTMTPKIISDTKITDDCQFARQAGKMLHKNGKLIRVAQDCSKKEYGRALEFLEVDNLEPENYSEHLIKHISPADLRYEKRIHGKMGVHTYNRENNFEVIDLRLARFSLSATLKKIKIVFDMLLSKLR